MIYARGVKDLLCNPRYAQAFDVRAADWTEHNLPAPNRREDSNTTWRTLEAGIRAKGSWASSFFGFAKAAEVKTSTRCAMVAGLAEHGRYLHSFGDVGNSNWAATQYTGLATLALTMPELNDAQVWFEHAQRKILDDMRKGVYPDGVEDEETSHYHGVALSSFGGFLTLVQRSKRPPAPGMSAIVQRMWNYLAYSLDPSGVSPLNGDADTDNNSAAVLGAAQTFHRPDWQYIASNGRHGTRPEGNYSRVFPWAGQLVSRSGWDAHAQWSWFDLGPFGSSGHGHQCRTHLSIRLGNEHILVDSGRFSYDGDLSAYLRDYGHVSRGHNVLLLDGKNQVETPAKASTPASVDTWSVTEAEDRARKSISFSGLPTADVHTRSLVYRRGSFWLVVDRVETTKSRTVEALWHTHPDCAVTIVGSVAQVSNNVAGIDVIAASDSTGRWKNTSVIRGQTKPILQGWFSPTYGTKIASPTISHLADVGQGETTFAWLLVPTRRGIPSGAAATVTQENGTHVVVTVVYEFPPPAIGSIKENITVDVRREHARENLLGVPFLNNNERVH